MALVECWLAHCRAAGIDDAATAGLLGDILTQLATLRALSLAVAGQLARGLRHATEAALVKDLGTEPEQRIPDLIATTPGRRPGRPATPDLPRTPASVDPVNPKFSLPNRNSV